MSEAQWDGFVVNFMYFLLAVSILGAVYLVVEYMHLGKNKYLLPIVKPLRWLAEKLDRFVMAMWPF